MSRYLVAVCGVVQMELLWSAQNAREYDRVLSMLKASTDYVDTSEADLVSARAVQQELWARGKVRAVGFADLIIAAVAKRHGLTVLHYDSDYEHVAAVTGQATEWIAPRGSIIGAG